MKRVTKRPSRLPLLQAPIAIGGAGFLLLAVMVAVAFVANESKANRAKAENLAMLETQEQLSAPHVPGEVVVGYKPAATDQIKQDNIGRHGGRLNKRNARLHADVRVVPNADEATTLQDLKTRPDVAFAEPNFLRKMRAAPNDPNYTQQWGYKTASFDTAWTTTTGAGAPLIAQIDSGVDMTHPDLAAHIAPGGYDEVNSDNIPNDDEGHGTATFGIIAEIANNGIGGVGGCWECKILPIKVLDSQGSGTTADVAAGIIYAADHGAKIINFSLGSSTSSTVEANAVAYAIGKGILFVGAVCEDETTNPAKDYPSSYPGVLGVGALTQNNTLEAWSCYGSYVKLSAPSTAYTTAPGGKYEPSFQGTSAAAPFVTAAAALLWAAHPSATRDQVMAALMSGTNACCTNTAGGGLNVQKALLSLDTSTPTVKPADINKDGFVNVFDLSILLNKWNSTDVASDINKDGVVNIFDLSMVLSAWSP
jgi:subtilisin family serine protease